MCNRQSEKPRSATTIGETLSPLRTERLFRLCQRGPEPHRCGDVVFTIAVIDDNTGPDPHDRRMMSATTGACDMMVRQGQRLPSCASRHEIPSRLWPTSCGMVAGNGENVTLSDDCPLTDTGKRRGAAKPGRLAKCPPPPSLRHGIVTGGEDP